MEKKRVLLYWEIIVMVVSLHLTSFKAKKDLVPHFPLFKMLPFSYLEDIKNSNMGT